MSARIRDRATVAGVACGIALLIALYVTWSAQLTISVNPFLIIVIGAVGLNLLTGTAGEPSLGQAALLAVGAFTVAFTTNVWHWPFVPAIVAAVVVGSVVHVVTGATTARLKGLYAILSSLALQAIVVYVVTYYQLRGNATAAFSIPIASLFGFQINSPRSWYVLLLVVAALMLLGYWRLLRTDHGRAWMAIRTRPSTAAALGIPVARYRILAFGISGGIAALAGALEAYYIGTVSSDSYTLQLAVLYVSVIVVGGLGSPLGCVLGGLLISVVPAEIQYVVQTVSPSAGASPNIPQFESILQGALLVLFLMVLPGGLAAGWRFRRRRAAARPAEGALSASGQRTAPARSVTAQVVSGMSALRLTTTRRVIALDPESPLLSAADLVVGYPGAGLALHGVSLELHASEVIAVVGPNGAGKTTLVRALSGFTGEERGFIRSGTIHLGGHDVTRASAYHRASNGITLIPEREKVFSDLTVYENLYVSAGRNAHASIDRVLEGFPALTSKLTRKAVLLSGGERHMLALARALILNPKVLLVDETTLGLAPKAAGDAMSQLREVARLYGTGVILVEQNVQLALDHSDRYYVLNRGLIVSAASSTDGARESVDAFMGASI